MSNYGEIIGPSLNFTRRGAEICEFFVANLPNSVRSSIDQFLQLTFGYLGTAVSVTAVACRIWFN